jgi:hypothetical protein
LDIFLQMASLPILVSNPSRDQKPNYGRQMLQIDGRVKELTEEQAHNRDIILAPYLGPKTKLFAAQQQQHHIIILAAAGTGKTTSSLSIPYFATKDRFLLLTFNNELCGNTKHRVEFDWGLENTDVYTFHGFMNRYFGTCRNDIDLYDLLAKTNLEPKVKMPRWARVCLDEFQDANYGIYAISQLILYWQRKLYPPSISQPPTQLIIMGDTLQCLYEYSGADRRFITLAKLIYTNPVQKKLPAAATGMVNVSIEPIKFTNLALTQTFRCTQPMVDFINRVMLGYPKMTSVKPGIKPQLHICNIFDITEKHPLFRLVLGLIKKAKGDYGQIAIISPAVRNNQTITRLANLLTSKGVPLYISANETDVKNEKRLSAGKLVITSVHKSKGREWPYVVVLGFDDYYETRDSESTNEEQHRREHDQQAETTRTCPDIAYVAVSRAETELHLVQHYMNGLPRYINRAELPRFVDIQEHTKRPTNISLTKGQKPIIHKASEIARHMDISIIRQAVGRLGIQQLNPAGEDEQIIATPNEYIAPDGRVEDISSINGIAVPVWYECHFRRKAPEILAMITRMLGSDNGRQFAKYYNPDWQTKAKKPSEYTVRDVLQMSNLYMGLRDGYLYLCQQMEGACWDWISVAQLNEAARRINEVIQRLVPETTAEKSTKLEFEKSCSDPKNHICGSIDLYTALMVFEFKFKSGLATEDVLQTAISMLLGHNIGMNELLKTVDSMTEWRLESLEHIKPGHTILAYLGKYHEPAALKVVNSNSAANQLICVPNGSKKVVGEIIINTTDAIADLSWLKQQGLIHDKQGLLFNIKTGEILLITAKRADLEEMLGIILKEKERLNSGNFNRPTDSEFLAKCLAIQDGIWSGSGVDIEAL